MFISLFGLSFVSPLLVMDYGLGYELVTSSAVPVLTHSAGLVFGLLFLSSLTRVMVVESRSRVCFSTIFIFAH